MLRKALVTTGITAGVVTAVCKAADNVMSLNSSIMENYHCALFPVPHQCTAQEMLDYYNRKFGTSFTMDQAEEAKKYFFGNN